MDEKYSRIEKNSNLYIVDDHKLRFLIYYILLPLFIFLSMIVILTDNVSAKEQVSNLTISSRAYLPCGSGSSNTYCSQTYQGTYARKNVGTSYNGVLGYISFQFQQNLSTTIASQFLIDIYSVSTDFRNNALSVEFYSSSQSDTLGNLGAYTFSFVSKNHIRLIVLPDNLTYHTIVMLGDPLTGISTYGIKKVTLTYDDGTQDNSAIINNQNQNTQDIINSSNSNTSDILGSIGGISLDIYNLSTTFDTGIQDLINDQSCPIGPLGIGGNNWIYIKDKYLNSVGEQIDSTGYYISPYIQIKQGVAYNMLLSGAVNAPSACFYRRTSTSSNSLISCFSYSRSQDITFNAPPDAMYMLISYGTTLNVSLNGPVCNKWESDKLSESNRIAQETQQSVDNLRNELTNDNVSGDVPNSFFDDFTTTDFNGISRILTKPMVLVNNMLSSSNSCSSLQTSITIPSIGSYGGSTTNIELPSGCVLWNNVPNAINLTWQAFTIGLACYFILKDLLLTSEKLEAPHDNKTEVMKL